MSRGIARAIWEAQLLLRSTVPSGSHLHQLQQRRRWSGGAGGSAGAGGASAGAGAAATAPPLKVALKSLFLRVHPDLFADWPAEQAENQRSFQLLQEYLEQARREPGGPGAGGPLSRTPFRFRFFLRPEPGGGGGSDLEDEGGGGGRGAGGGDGGAAAGGLVRVELTLPPPEPSPAGGGALSPATKKALGRLLGLCGLGFDETAAESAEEAAARGRLLVFLPEAAEAVRQAESGAVGWDVRAANIRGAMRLARQVVVGFGAGGFPGPRQVELLQALARVLDELAAEGVEMAGAHIMFCSTTAMDARGTLWLDASEEDREAWADFLGGADLSFAASRRAAAEALRRLEGAAAAAAGLGMVFCPAGLSGALEYREFLERLAAHAATHGPILARAGSGGVAAAPSGGGIGKAEHQQQAAGPPFGALPLYVAPPASPGGSTSSGGSSGGGGAGSSSSDSCGSGIGFELREGIGCLQVPVTAGAHQVYGFVQDRGAEALQLLAARRAQEERLEALAARVRARLRLRRFSRDPLIPPWQFEAACGRLLQHAAALSQLAEGLSVRVSDANRVAGHGVDLAWDAEP